MSDKLREIVWRTAAMLKREGDSQGDPFMQMCGDQLRAVLADSATADAPLGKEMDTWVCRGCHCSWHNWRGQRKLTQCPNCKGSEIWDVETAPPSTNPDTSQYLLVGGEPTDEMVEAAIASFPDGVLGGCCAHIPNALRAALAVQQREGK